MHKALRSLVGVRDPQAQLIMGYAANSALVSSRPATVSFIAVTCCKTLALLTTVVVGTSHVDNKYVGIGDGQRGVVGKSHVDNITRFGSTPRSTRGKAEESDDRRREKQA